MHTMERPLRKLCLLGDYRVGKTRLACRLTGCEVKPPPYGVQLHHWRLPDAPDVEFVLFDVAGRSSLDSLGQSFLSGAEGLALVADAGVPGSIDVALRLHRCATDLIGARPAVLLLNKTDLASGSTVETELPLFHVSARSGAGVLEAFSLLAERVLAASPSHGALAACVQTCGVS